MRFAPIKLVPLARICNSKLGMLRPGYCRSRRERLRGGEEENDEDDDGGAREAPDSRFRQLSALKFTHAKSTK